MPDLHAIMRSHKKDLPKYTYKRRENNLVARVEQARERGMSYGKYMAMLHDGLIEDPMVGGERDA